MKENSSVFSGAGGKVKDGIIYSEDSLPYLARFLADDRISAEVTGRGIGDIEYFCPNTQGNCKIFAEEFWGGLRYYIRAGGDVLPLDARNTGKSSIRKIKKRSNISALLLIRAAET